MADKKTVDGYIAGLDGWQKDAAAQLRALVLDAVPEAKESIKWSQPVFEAGHGPFAFIKAFKSHINFGFWRGAQIDDPYGLVQSGGEKMGHVKIASLADVKKKELGELTRASARLNEERGDPTKNP